MREYEPYKPSQQGTGTLDADTLSQCIAALFDHEPIERADGVRNWVYTPAGSLPPLPTNVRSRQIAPNVWEHVFTPTWTTPEDMGIAGISFDTLPTGQLFIQAHGQAKGNFIKLYHHLRAQQMREHRRKLIARRQKRAAFRRKKRGVA